MPPSYKIMVISQIIHISLMNIIYYLLWFIMLLSIIGFKPTNLHVSVDGEYTLKCFSNSSRHVSSSTRFSNLSLASLSAPVSLAAYIREFVVFTMHLLSINLVLKNNWSQKVERSASVMLIWEVKLTILSFLSSFLATLALQRHWSVRVAFFCCL